VTLKTMRTDQIGSLLQPRPLIDAFIARGSGEIDDAELARIQDAAIRDIVSKQEAAGLGVVSDGEFRRLNWQVSFSEVDGWYLWEGSWRLFLKRPGQDASDEEKPGMRGADAVEVFKVPASSVGCGWRRRCSTVSTPSNASLSSLCSPRGTARSCWAR